MAEFIAFFLLIVSFTGISAMLLQKTPFLLDFSQTADIKKISKETDVKISSSLDFLEKFLLKFKILTLKTENKTSSWLEKLREKKQENGFSDDYWEKIKKKNKPR